MILFLPCCYWHWHVDPFFSSDAWWQGNQWNVKEISNKLESKQRCSQEKTEKAAGALPGGCNISQLPHKCPDAACNTGSSVCWHGLHDQFWNEPTSAEHGGPRDGSDDTQRGTADCGRHAKRGAQPCHAQQNTCRELLQVKVRMDYQSLVHIIQLHAFLETHTYISEQTTVLAEATNKPVSTQHVSVSGHHNSWPWLRNLWHIQRNGLSYIFPGFRTFMLLLEPW